MFQIYQDDGGYLIAETQFPSNCMSVASLSDLLLLRKRINQYIDTMQADGPPQAQHDMLTTVEAREIAAARGHTIPNDTILAAIKSGRIKQAGKDGGRWKMPRWAFERWLDATIKKRERLAQQV